MSLIQDTQRDQASTPPLKTIEFVAPGAPPAPQQAPIQPQTAPAPPTEEQQVTDLTSPETTEAVPLPSLDEQLEIKELTGLTPASNSPASPRTPVDRRALEQPINIEPVPILRDAERDFGFSKLYDNQLMNTQLPTLYRDGFQGIPGLVNDAAALFQFSAQENERQRVTQERQLAQTVNSTRFVRPNLPDSTKPWWEQATGWIGQAASNVLFGSEDQQFLAKQGVANPLVGAYGIHGAGIGGLLKTALSVPLGIVNAIGADNAIQSRDELMLRLSNENPTVQVNRNGRPFITKYNSLSKDEKFDYAEQRINQTSDLERSTKIGHGFYFDRYRNLRGNPFASLYVYADVLRLSVVGDDLNDANPYLPPAKDENGNVLGKPEPPKGFFYDKFRPPGAGATALDPRTGQRYSNSVFTEVGNQVLNPANWLLDPVGDVISNAVTGIFGRASKKVGRVLGVSAEETTQAIAKEAGEQAAENLARTLAPDLNLRPQSRSATPEYRGRAIRQAKREAAARASGTVVKPKAPGQLALPASTTSGVAKASQEQTLRGVSNIGGETIESKVRLLPPNTPQPLTSTPASVVAKVGVGEPGEQVLPIVFSRRSYGEAIADLKKNYPELMGDYKGNSWNNLRNHLLDKGVPLDEASSIGERYNPRQPIPPSRAIVPVEDKGSAVVKFSDGGGVANVNPQPNDYFRSTQLLIDAATEEVPDTGRRFIVVPGKGVLPPSIPNRPGFVKGGVPQTFTPNPVRLPNLVEKTTAEGFTKEDLLRQFEDVNNLRTLLDNGLAKLESFFDDTVDMGRQEMPELPVRPVTTDDVLRTMETYGEPPPMVPEAEQMIRTAKEVSEGSVQEEVVKSAVEINNARLANPTESTPVAGVEPGNVRPRANEINTKSIDYTSSPGQKYYHGTAIADWNGAYDLDMYGSRGELGYGLYLTKDIQEATAYSKALVGENAPAPTREMSLGQGVYQVVPGQNPGKALNARATIGGRSKFFGFLNQSIEDFIKPPSLTVRKMSYVDYLAKVEKAVAEAGGGEQLLRDVQRNISQALREMGYGSVIDDESGWKLMLSNSGITARKLETATETTLDLAKKTAEVAKSATPQKAIAPSIETVKENLGNIKWKKHSLAKGEVFKAKPENILDIVAKDNPKEMVVRKGQNEIGDRYAQAIDFLSTSKEVNAIELVVNERGQLTVKDGRHRLAVLSDAGAGRTPFILSGSKKGREILIDRLRELAADKAARAVAEELPAEDAVSQAVRARHNVDSATAAAYPKSLTADANLRDSTAKLYNDTKANLDEQLEAITKDIESLDGQNPVSPLSSGKSENGMYPVPQMKSDAEMELGNEIAGDNAIAPRVEKTPDGYMSYDLGGESLRNILVQNPGKLKTTELSMLMEGAKEVLDAIHSMGYRHGDPSFGNFTLNKKLMAFQAIDLSGAGKATFSERLEEIDDLFYSMVRELQNNGYSDEQIAEAMSTETLKKAGIEPSDYILPKGKDVSELLDDANVKMGDIDPCNT